MFTELPLLLKLCYCLHLLHYYHYYYYNGFLLTAGG